MWLSSLMSWLFAEGAEAFKTFSYSSSRPLVDIASVYKKILNDMEPAFLGSTSSIVRLALQMEHCRYCLKLSVSTGSLSGFLVQLTGIVLHGSFLEKIDLNLFWRLDFFSLGISFRDFEIRFLELPVEWG